MTAKGAKADTDRPQPAQPERKPRNILLFSDGTGNSSAKLQKTNVWRLYEAADLGIPEHPDRIEQIAYYDNGVGTSNFKPLAVLGGVFGFGLARNVRNLYLFLCRNYRPGDRIFAFGFSRGAYTIRLLVALVCAFGVAVEKDEAYLELVAHDTWNQSRQSFHTSNFFTDLLVAVGRAVLRRMVWLWRMAMGQPSNYRFHEGRWWARDWYDYWIARYFGKIGRKIANRRLSPANSGSDRPAVNTSSFDSSHGPENFAIGELDARGLLQVDIEFVGVWDTVAAYGGPFVEFTRAIDEWIWPLSMPHYGLHERVKDARHALAIDDKRDAFHPLLWDEVHEIELAQRYSAELKTAGRKASQRLKQLAARFNHAGRPKGQRHPRLQQVWFAGMHADVGGGYADESLSYVSLWWMIEHAEKSGLQLLSTFRERIRVSRNIYGPLHDSRGGVGSLYRYQPRYINAWVDWRRPRPWTISFPRREVIAHVQPATQIFRDPTINRGRYRERGLLRSPIRLHWSVEARLREGTDGYAPNNLPAQYLVDRGIDGLSRRDHPQSVNAETRDARLAIELQLGDRIKLRRFWYFLTIVLMVALVSRPVWHLLPGLRNYVGTVDARVDAHLIEAVIAAFLPAFLKAWLHAIFADLFTVLVVAVMVGLTVALGQAHERAMKDLARALWKSRFENAMPQLRALVWWQRPAQWVARFVHKSDELQAVLAWIKWKAVPFLLGAVLWVTVLYWVLAALTQLMLIGAEIRPEACVAKQGHGSLIGAAPVSFPATGNGGTAAIDTREHCVDTGIRLAADKRYKIAVQILDTNGNPTGTWQDGSHPATPQGWVEPKGADVSIEMGSKYFRRVVSAPLFAPILDFRPDSDGNPAEGTSRFVPTHMVWPRLKQSVDPATPNLWEGEFTTPTRQSRTFRFGEREDQAQARLYVFLNDAKLLNSWSFYSHNHGGFRVCVWAAEEPLTAHDCDGFIQIKAKSPVPAH